MKASKFVVYLKGGHSFKVRAESIDLKWDNNGNVTYYKFNWDKEREKMFGLPPQSIIGIRRLR